MQKNSLILLFLIVWISVTCWALLFGFNYNWPDYVHVDYGVPLTWGTNTLSTFAGPVDQWSINTLNLLVDLIFWLGIMAAAVALLLHKLEP
jgi:hypothetical protein